MRSLSAMFIVYHAADAHAAARSRNKQNQERFPDFQVKPVLVQAALRRDRHINATLLVSRGSSGDYVLAYAAAMENVAAKRRRPVRGSTTTIRGAFWGSDDD